MSDEADIVQNLEDIVEQLVEVETVPLPQTVKAAVIEGWELTVDTLQIQGLLYYDEDQRKIDKTRAITLKVAMETLAVLEAAYVEEFTQTIGSIIYNIPAELVKSALPIFKAVKLIATHPNQFWYVVREGWKQVFAAMALTEIGKEIARGVKLRETIIKDMRKKTLPQRTGPRYRRRKVTRK